ncbi:ATP-binding protein [Streptomyces sp. NBC_01304]|uniref:ATP-binding protein n=1 Tax=Streptomyces sp. NBC_01304 TaxID=2903818 RepID=UPI002E0D95DD|nr:ATP-binding protein [Streptomyces sp. NBC_01304]
METVAPAPWAYTLQLPHDPRAPGIARATLRAVLESHGLDDLRLTAELLTSELVTNAHLHTTGPYALRIGQRPEGRLRVGVWDANPEIPPPFTGHSQDPGVDAESGRGLLLVQACAARYGAYALNQPGKYLWAECGQ